MKIAVIGSGNVGGALGRRWAEGGHDIVFGSRDPEGQKVQALVKSIGSKACATSLADAAKWGEVIVLATPWSAAQQSIQAMGSLNGKILIDTNNPLGPNFTLSVGHTTSAAEQVAGWAPGARVVKAFNVTGSGNMSNPDYGGQKLSMFICGDDAAAKAQVAHLAEELGFDVVDCGALVMARTLEPVAHLWVSLAYAQWLGPNFGFKLLKR